MSLECKNCCYFAVTDDPNWNGIEHCCFIELGHKYYEIAPCDFEDDYFEEEPNDYYG